MGYSPSIYVVAKIKLPNIVEDKDALINDIDIDGYCASFSACYEMFGEEIEYDPNYIYIWNCVVSEYGFFEPLYLEQEGHKLAEYVLTKFPHTSEEDNIYYSLAYN